MAYEFLKSLSVSAISKYILDQGRNQCQADLHFFRCADELVRGQVGVFRLPNSNPNFWLAENNHVKF